MRKIYLISAYLCLFLGIVLTFFPTEQLAVIPTVLALVFSFLAFRISDNDKKTVPKWVLIFSVLVLIAILAKLILLKDEVVIDKQDQVQKVESVKQDKKDLEDLEGL